MLLRVNVDFQKQTVDPMQVSFNTLDRPRTVADLLLTIDVTEVRVCYWVLRASPASTSEDTGHETGPSCACRSRW